MFLDANGDGVNDAGDFLYGLESVTVDVYLDTDRNADGSPAVCQSNPSQALTLRGYALNLYNSFEAVEITDITNQLSGMGEVFAPRVFPYALSLAYAGGAALPAGRYHLLRMTVRLLGQEASLEIVRSSCFSPVGSETSIWSDCLGSQFDGLLRFGEDWTDVSSLHSSLHSNPTFHPPTISCPGEVAGVEGQPLAFTVSLFDADCADPGLGWSPLPSGASMSPLGPFVEGVASRTMTWTPGFDQAGVYSVLFSATESDRGGPGPTHYDSCRTSITILEGDQHPLANAGGPYFGVEGVEVVFDGSGSSDPDGGALEFLWSFGDGTTDTGPMPSFIYGAPGFYNVTLTVTEPGGLTDEDDTFADIMDRPVPTKAARVFTRPGFETTRVPHGRPETCFQIEALEAESFDPSDVDPLTVALQYAAPFCPEQSAHASSEKPWQVADSDRNGLPEVAACFERGSLGILVECLPPGKHRVSLRLTASLTNGERISADFEHTFVVGGGLGVRVWPNPPNPTGTLSFETTRAGRARVQLFSAAGRLVRTLLDASTLPAGLHEIPFGATDDAGRALATGVYYYRVQANGNVARGRVAVLK
jgi:PKD repeat protein